jgi:hypothetical protein
MELTDGEGGNLSNEKMQDSYSKKNFTPSAKPTRIIGDMDNQKTDE